MEVSCEKCGARYLFDEARIPAAGLSVKCSKCSHVFRAARGEQGPAAETTIGGQTGEQSIIRKTNGDVLQFRELSTLQRWIVERKVTRNDQISKSGTSWQNVGSIGELEPFFTAVEGPSPAQPQVGRSDLSLPDPGFERGPSSVGSGAWNIGSGQHRAGPQASFDAHIPPSYPNTVVNSESPSANSVFGRPTQNLGDPNGDDFDDLFPKRRRKGKWVALLLLLVAGGGLGALYYHDPARVRGFFERLVGVPAAAEQHLVAGYRSLDRDTEAGLTAAHEHFEKALLVAPRYADAKAGLADVALVRAEGLAYEAAALAEQVQKAPDADKEALGKQVQAKQALLDEQLRRAFELAKAAIDMNGTAVAANRTMADYYRLVGNSTQMAPLLELASREAPGDPRTAYVRGAAIANEAGRADEAATELSVVLTKRPLMHRARYRLADLHRRSDNRDAAVAALEEILADAPDHGRAHAMLEQLKLPAPPQAPPEPPAEPDPAKAPVSVTSLLAQAERLRDSDQADRAMRLYNRALDLDNSDPDVHTGLGWCYIDLERLDAAVESFRRALAVAPRFSDAHMGLAEAYRAKGMKRDAVKHYRKYLDVLPDGPEAAVARRMLRTLSQ